MITAEAVEAIAPDPPGKYKLAKALEPVDADTLLDERYAPRKRWAEGGSRMNDVGTAPVYLLAGGPGSRRAQRDPLLTRAIASCGVTEPSIAYIGAASGDDKSFFKMIAGFCARAARGRSCSRRSPESASSSTEPARSSRWPMRSS